MKYSTSYIFISNKVYFLFTFNHYIYLSIFWYLYLMFLLNNLNKKKKLKKICLYSINKKIVYRLKVKKKIMAHCYDS